MPGLIAKSIRPLQGLAARAVNPPKPPLLTRVVTPGFWPVEPEPRVIPDDPQPGYFGRATGWIARLGARPPVLTQVVAEGPLPIAIQLKTSLRPFDAHTLPALDALRRYDLYETRHTSAGMEWRRLRLGFFPDSASARAVLDEVRQHFRDALIVGVGAGERRAFARGGLSI